MGVWLIICIQRCTLHQFHTFLYAVYSHLQINIRFEQGKEVTVGLMERDMGGAYSKSTVRREMVGMGYQFKNEGRDVYVRERDDVVQKRIR